MLVSPAPPGRPPAFVDANTEMRRTSTSVFPPARLNADAVRTFICRLRRPCLAFKPEPDVAAERTGNTSLQPASALNALISPGLGEPQIFRLLVLLHGSESVAKPPVLTDLCKFTLLATLQSLRTSTCFSSTARPHGLTQSRRRSSSRLLLRGMRRGVPATVLGRKHMAGTRCKQPRKLEQ